MKACRECKVVGKHHPSCPTLQKPKIEADYSIEAYRTFLERKCAVSPEYGVPVDAGEIHPFLKLHQKAAVQWAVRGGRRAIFASFGLGKSIIQMETLRLILKVAGGRGLIVAPLGVRQEFQKDAKKIDLEIQFVRSIEECGPEGLYLTNYETVRDGKLDPRHFTVTSLDEAAILRSFGGTKTFREFMRLFDGVPYRFVATATPDPNEYIELLAYSAYLGILDAGEGKTRFFKRDATKADKLTLHAHKVREWWLWVASWGLFLFRPSDLGPEYSDEGYDVPPLEVVLHEIPVEHNEVTPERDGQGRMFREAMHGVVDAAREKRDTLDDRVAKAAQIVAAEPDEHWLLWHDLENERRAIEKAIPDVTSVYGAQRSSESDVLEESILAFSEGRIAKLAAKPSMFGCGANWQYHCARAIYVGIGFKFADFIQAMHRIYRFLQNRPVIVHLIYAASEKRVLDSLLEKWERYKVQTAAMSEVIREYGLSKASIENALMRSLGCSRAEVSGKNWTLVNNDAVEEAETLALNSVDLILTSIPFSSQYEYSPSYNDFGHTESNDMFFEQLDFLTHRLMKILKPGRLAFIHVKDRIIPGGINGLGFQTVYPFHADCITHFTKHGFAYIGMKTIVTDVVRENNQTYRLGWTEQCKDGTKMGVGMPEYLLLFRRPPTESTNAYADEPVKKLKKNFDQKTGEWQNGNGYSRARWQIDAHAFMRSSGDRPLAPEDLVGVPHATIFKLFRKYSLSQVYDFEQHVKLGEHLEMKGILPVTFMLLQPQSWSPEVWSDVTRMRTLNGAQSAKGKEMHLCPMQFDLADRVIEQCSQEGELVYDPFGGLGTVPMRAVMKRRRGFSTELSTSYWIDSQVYCKAAEQKLETPTLFDLIQEPEGESAADVV